MGGKRIQFWSNACSIYPSIFNRLRAIARYWSEIATFSYSLHLIPPLGVFPLEFLEKFGPQKTRIMGLPGSEDNLTIAWAVSTQYQRVTDRETDRRTDRRSAYINNVRSILTHVKNCIGTVFCAVCNKSNCKRSTGSCLRASSEVFCLLRTACRLIWTIWLTGQWQSANTANKSRDTGWRTMNGKLN